MSRPTAARLICVLAGIASAALPYARVEAGKDAAAEGKSAELGGGLRDEFIAPPPLDAAPQPHPLATLRVRAPIRWLPPAGVVAAPRPLPSDGRHALFHRPAHSRTRLAFDRPGLPPRPPLAAGPLAYEPSPDPNRLPILPKRPTPDPARNTVTDDPTYAQSVRAVLAVMPSLQHVPAPFLRLQIPDPFALLTAVQMPDQPPETHPPETAADPPLPKTLRREKRRPAK